jgi:hypothetical protein
MSEKKPFDAAIAVLKTELRECSPDEEDEFCDFIQSLTDNQYEKGLRIAIRVLEAAGKVDKAHSLDKLDFLRRMAGEDRAGFVRYREDGLAIFPTAQIRALLETLPDKEQK